MINNTHAGRDVHITLQQVPFAAGMMDAIKAYTDAATRIIPAFDLHGQKRRDQTADIGLQLFDLYRDTMQIARNGFEVIRQLTVVTQSNKEYYRDRDFYDERGGPRASIRHTKELQLVLQSQALSLKDLLSTYFRLATFAEIAETSDQVADQSRFFILRKSAEIKYLMVNTFAMDPLSGGEFCLSSELIQAGREQGYEPEFLILGAQRTHPFGKVPWDETTNKIADYYITSGLAKKRIDDLIISASNFRIAFQKAFKIEDILLAAEKRLAGDSMHKS